MYCGDDLYVGQQHKISCQEQRQLQEDKRLSFDFNKQ